MGEIGPEPVDPIQTAVAFFKNENEDWRNQSSTTDGSEKDTEDSENLKQESANVRVQHEMKEDESKQAFLKLNHYEETAEELSTQLESSEIETEICKYECKDAEAQARINETESRMQDMDNRWSEYADAQEELPGVLGEVRASEEHGLSLEAKIESMKRAEVAESAWTAEKLRSEELLRNIRELEAEVFDKSLLIDSLQSEVCRAKELHSCAEKVAFDALCELNGLKAEMEIKEGKNLDQGRYINSLETELEGVKVELNKANEEKSILRKNVEEMKEKETEAGIEMALLKSELHKGRSRLVAAAAAEERAMVEKSAVYAALHHLAAEALEAKNENRQLKETSATPADTKTNVPFKEPGLQGNKKVDLHVTISREEHEDLIKKAEKGNHVHNLENEYKAESEKWKKEIQMANAKLGELRTRAEQAISRAEAAEKVKATLEERIKRWKEQKAKKKAAALATLHKEVISMEDSSLSYKNAPKVYQPLGKILNMKF